MAGVDLRTAQELMGHKTIAMTCRYAHLAPKHQLEAISRLDGWGRTDTRTDTEAFQGNSAVLPHARQVTVQ